MDKAEKDCDKEPGRTFNIDSGSTYIEKQEINFKHVDKLIIAADGKCADGKSLMENLVKALGQEECPDNAVTEPSNSPQEESEISRLDRNLNSPVITCLDVFYAGLKYVKEQNVVINDYEWAAIKYRIDSYGFFKKLSDNSFVDILIASGTFTKEDCPKADNLKTLIIDGKYPQWRIIGKKCENYAQIMKVVKTFDEGCRKYLNEYRK